jgi:AraC family transcriptional regulator
MKEQESTLVDFRQADASNALLPNSAIFSNAAWNNLYLEVHEQPKFALDEHQQTMHVLAHILSRSSGERWFDGKCNYEQRNIGDVAICPEGVVHRCNWETATQFMILAIEPELLKQMGQDWMNPDQIELIPQFSTGEDVLMHGILTKFREELEAGEISNYLLIDSLKTALTIHLLQKYSTAKPKPAKANNGLSEAKLQQVTEYINEHLAQDLKLNEIAAIAQLSPYHFSRLFKESMGITLHQYILQRRVEKAKYLLQYSQLSISEVATKVGFFDQSHLTRYFKQIVGVTPKQFLKAR